MRQIFIFHIFVFLYFAIGINSTVHAQGVPPQYPNESDSTYVDRLEILLDDIIKKEDYVLADSVIQKALKITKQTEGENSNRYNMLLVARSNVNLNTEKFEEAEVVLKQVIEFYEKNNLQTSTYYAGALNNMGILYLYMGMNQEGINMLETSLKIQKETSDIENADYAEGLSNLSAAYLSISNFDKAEKLGIEALTLQEKVSGINSVNNIYILKILSYIYALKGNYNAAALLIEKAMKIAHDMGNDKGDIYPTLLLAQAEIHYSVGNYKEAMLCYETINKNFANKLESSEVTMLNNLAALHADIGNYKLAIDLCEQAIAIQEKMGFTREVLIFKNNLATIYMNSGDLFKADSLFSEVINVYKNNNQKKDLYYIKTLINYAVLLRKQNKYKECQSILLDNMPLLEKITGQNYHDYIVYLNSLGDTYFMLGDLSKANDLYSKSLYGYEKLENKRNSDYCVFLSHLALFQQQTQNYPAAQALYREALSTYQQQIQKNFIWLSEKARDQYYETLKSTFESYQSFARKANSSLPQTRSDAYNDALFTKAILLNSSLQMRRRIAESQDSSLLHAYDTWIGQRCWLAKVYEMESEKRQQLGINLDSLEQAADRAEASLSSRSEAFAQATDKTTYTWQNVQQQLQTNEAAVEIVRFRNYDKSTTDSVYYAVMVVTPQTKNYPAVVWLNGNDLERKHLQEYQKNLKEGANDFVSYTHFWQPFDSLLLGAKTVYLSLDGVYHQINLATLLTPNAQYMGDVCNLHLLNSTRDLVKKRPASTAPLTALLVGNPDFGADSTQLAQTLAQITRPSAQNAPTDAYLPDTLLRGPAPVLQSLPNTQVEIDNISQLLQQQHYQVSSYTGKKAMEEIVKNAQSPRILHLATHGSFLADTDTKSNRLLGENTSANTYINNPLLRSQLYFSGAQHTLDHQYPTGANYDNGILTAYEALNINLSNTDLVVLSACETGRGENRTGEGVFGLQRAFQLAGSRSLIMSLWKIGDKATQAFMTDFYSEWQKGKTKRQAFATAQQNLRQQYPHPYYWGAFIIVGE